MNYFFLFLDGQFLFLLFVVRLLFFLVFSCSLLHLHKLIPGLRMHMVWSLPSISLQHFLEWIDTHLVRFDEMTLYKCFHFFFIHWADFILIFILYNPIFIFFIFVFFNITIIFFKLFLS